MIRAWLVLIIFCSAPVWSAGESLAMVEENPYESGKKPIEFYGGILMGNISQTNTDGSSNRESYFTYGIETMTYRENFGVGLNYRYFAPPRDGNSAVNVQQSNQWYELEGAYRFQPHNWYVPYGFVGVGAVNRSVKTTALSQTETYSDTFLARSIGLGCLFKTQTAFGFNVALRYYQYGRENGFLTSVSFGLASPTQFSF